MAYVYCLVLDEANIEIADKVREVWPDRNYVLTNSIMFMSPKGISTCRSVSEKLGLFKKEEDEDKKTPNHIVMDFSSTIYSGWHDGSVWEWLKKAREFKDE